jgi:hypothetical protein
VPARAISAISREVASLEASAGSGGGVRAAGALAAGTVPAAAAGGVTVCAATRAIGSASPSPGHSTTRRAPSPPSSRRGAIATIGLARSNTIRVVPATGWPVRTLRTTPRAAGSARPPRSLVPGRSTTRRSGLASEITENSALPSSRNSARVPVAPVCRSTPRSSAP